MLLGLKRIALLLFCGFALPGVSQVVPNENRVFQIDTQKSRIKWTGKKLGGSHYGTVRIKRGKVRSSKNSFLGKIGGEIVVDMKSIQCDDLKSPGSNSKLVKHLKSKDFFHVKKYKTAKLKIKKIEKGQGDRYLLDGRITIRGKTKKIQFPLNIQWSDKAFKATGTLTLDRTEFGVKYNSGKFYKALGDKLIYDDFSLHFEVYSK